MKDRELLLKIISRFKAKGKAKVIGYNEFGYVRETNSSIFVTRETGKDTPISHKRLLIGINAYLENPNLYYGKPSDLRAVGITHVTSPVFALLHLLDENEYLDNNSN